MHHMHAKGYKQQQPCSTTWCDCWQQETSMHTIFRQHYRGLYVHENNYTCHGKASDQHQSYCAQQQTGKAAVHSSLATN
jgi:hypothetical protein